MVRISVVSTDCTEVSHLHIPGVGSGMHYIPYTATSLLQRTDSTRWRLGEVMTYPRGSNDHTGTYLPSHRASAYDHCPRCIPGQTAPTPYLTCSGLQISHCICRRYPSDQSPAEPQSLKGRGEHYAFGGLLRPPAKSSAMLTKEFQRLRTSRASPMSSFVAMRLQMVYVARRLVPQLSERQPLRYGAAVRGISVMSTTIPAVGAPGMRSAKFGWQQQRPSLEQRELEPTALCGGGSNSTVIRKALPRYLHISGPSELFLPPRYSI